MRIELRQSKTRWVEIEKGIKFKVDYMTLEQEDELKDLLYRVGLIDDKMEFDKLSEDKLLKASSILKKYYRMFIRFTVKDWQGIKDTQGKAVKCKLVDDILDEQLWEGLVRNLSLDDLMIIYKKINDEIKFTEIDKKK